MSRNDDDEMKRLRRAAVEVSLKESDARLRQSNKLCIRYIQAASSFVTPVILQKIIDAVEGQCLKPGTSAPLDLKNEGPNELIQYRVRLREAFIADLCHTNDHIRISKKPFSELPPRKFKTAEELKVITEADVNTPPEI